MSSKYFARVIQSADSTQLVDLFDDSRRYSFPLKLDAKPVVQAGSVVVYTHTGDNKNPIGIESVLAAPQSASAGIWHALSDQRLNPRFPDAVMSEVTSILKSPDINDPALLDFSDLPFVTIDNVDSKDLDQAMCLETTGHNGFLLHYALADASHYVVPGSALFNEALKRGASYYVPGFSVPMLPRALSEGLVSLNEGRYRRALVFQIYFDHEGCVLDTTFVRARIKSRAKLSYSAVEQYYLDPEKSALAGQSYTATLDVLRMLGQQRIKQSRLRNVVEYDRTGIELDLTDDGSSFMITATQRLSVEKYNEQISLVCNSEGARLLESAGLPSVVQAVYRVHDAPDEERLKKFSRLLKGLIHQRKLSPELWAWRWRDGRHGNKETLASYLDRLKSAQVDRRLLSAVQRHALMLSSASRFAAQAGAHHSLKLDQYARFSSPMREIAGIFTHRELLQYQRVEDNAGSPAVTGSYDDEALRQQVIVAANRSRDIQKKLNKAVLKTAIDQLFEPELLKAEGDRTVWIGTVVSLRSTRVYVCLDEPAIVVKIYLRDLSRLTAIDYALDNSNAFTVNKMTGESLFSLGDKVSLKAYEYLKDNKRWWLVPL